MTSYSAAAIVPTASASRYLQQLCKHWSHKLAVEFTASEGRIVMPKEGRGETFPLDAIVSLKAGEAALEVHVDASELRQLELVKDAIANHLNRFAFREGPLGFDWR